MEQENAFNFSSYGRSQGVGNLKMEQEVETEIEKKANEETS